MKQLAILSFLVIQANFLLAQNYQSTEIDVLHTPTVATYLGTFQPVVDSSGLFPEFRGIHDAINEGEDQLKLREYKDSLNARKRALLGTSAVSSYKTRASTDPVKVSGFRALSSSSTPMDNTMAIGKNGKLIAAINSALMVYNKSGTATSVYHNFPTFWNSVTNKNNLCDPLVQYDPQADRFIIFTQICDRSTLNNVVLMAFSATNDPNGSFHFYSFKTNLRELIGTSYPYDVWFDYPKMGVSASDIFITGNMFQNVTVNQSVYVESVILQIDKAACYAGANSVPSEIYYNLPGNPFTLVPAAHGRDDNYGDVMHLASSRRVFSNSYVQMFTITGKVNSTQTPTISYADVPVPSFSSPADGIQLGTNILLNTGDSRGMSAMYVDGTVHFVFHCDGPNNFVAINYNRLKRSGNTWSVVNKVITQPNTDCAYPSIASMGWTDQDQSALIVYDYSSATTYPGIRTIFVDHDMNVSNATELQQRDDNVLIVGQNDPMLARWGDYSGIAREHNASTPTVWGFGMYGNVSHGWSNYVSEIRTNAWPVATSEIRQENNNAKLYPNPVIDSWHLRLNILESGKLEVELYDIQGKKVRDVYTANVSKGEANFSFNKNGLSNGTYVVKILLNNSKIANEKIIVSK